MRRRTPQEARALGLWTAGWLAALLVAGLMWVGNVGLQWPVLLVPLLWALVALRHRERRDVLPQDPARYPATRPMPRSGPRRPREPW